jgi:carbamoyl-phosphate synthase small subunit
MRFKEKADAVLVLEDGTVFKGKAAGKIGTTTGEIAFNTGMTGYQEIFTDPSYYQQILVMTPAHIGNYGTHDEEIESESVKIAGLVCKKFSEIDSRPSSEANVQDYFENHGVVGISDVDTRALVRHIRDKGAMNAIISSDVLDITKLKAQVKEVPSMEGLELSSKVSTKEAFTLGDENSDLKVAVLDLGVKKNILRCLTERGCYLKVFPHTASLNEMMEFNPDGFMLSNGPGDPAAMPNETQTVKDILDSGVPTFGICLGHQVLATASGLSTAKMHNGHRGINHPVLNLETKKGEITSQNHGFVVDAESVTSEANITITHRHLNDNTIAGIKRNDVPAFSVQYHPEASAGPHDSRYLFDDFVSLMKEHKK